MTKQSLEITIPVLNEEKRLEQGVSTTINFLEQYGIKDYKIVIADNGSIDDTEKIGKMLVDLYRDKVIYIKIPNPGVGLALRSSWLKAKSDIVGYMDVDLSTDLSHLIEVIDLFKNENVKIVNGSRLKRGAIIFNRKIIREITSRGFNNLLKMLIGIKFTDGMCGFKFFRRDVATELINTGIDIDGWFFCTEILVKAEWKGININEIPITWSDDSDSRVKIIKLSSNYFKEIMRLREEMKFWSK